MSVHIKKDLSFSQIPQKHPSIKVENDKPWKGRKVASQKQSDHKTSNLSLDSTRISKTKLSGAERKHKFRIRGKNPSPVKKMNTGNQQKAATSAQPKSISGNLTVKPASSESGKSNDKNSKNTDWFGFGDLMRAVTHLSEGHYGSALGSALKGTTKLALWGGIAFAGYQAASHPAAIQTHASILSSSDRNLAVRNVFKSCINDPSLECHDSLLAASKWINPSTQDLIEQCPNAQNPACDQLFEESSHRMKEKLTKKCIGDPTQLRCQNILDRSLNNGMDARRMIIECGEAMDSGTILTSHCTTFVKRVNNEMMCTQFKEKCTEKVNKMETGGARATMIRICRSNSKDENCKDVLTDQARHIKGWTANYHNPDILGSFAGHLDESSQQAIGILAPAIFEEFWSQPTRCTQIYGSIPHEKRDIAPCLRSNDPACRKAIDDATAFIASKEVKDNSKLSYKERDIKQEFLTNDCLEVIKGYVEQSGNPPHSQGLSDLISKKLKTFYEKNGEQL